MMNQNAVIFQPSADLSVGNRAFACDTSPADSGQGKPGMALAILDSLPHGRVKVPMRIVESAYYSDAAVTVYMKIKALGVRKEACTAGLATLASYLGLSISTVQRGLAELRSPAPDGVIELPDSRRRTLRGGTGTTARRRVRAMWPNERFIWLPVAASERLRPRLLRAYAVISFAVVQNMPLTERELAGHLRHHSGPKAAGRSPPRRPGASSTNWPNPAGSPSIDGPEHGGAISSASPSRRPRRLLHLMTCPVPILTTIPSRIRKT